MKKTLLLACCSILALSMVACNNPKDTVSGNANTDGEATTVAENETERTSEEGIPEINLDDATEITDSAEIAEAVKNYMVAVKNTSELTNYTLCIQNTSKQDCELPDYDLKNVIKIVCDIEQDENGSGLLSAKTSTTSPDGKLITGNMYYKDGKTYISSVAQGVQYYVDTYTFDDINPRTTDVASSITFDETAVKSLKEATNDGAVVYEFSLDPMDVTLSEAYSVAPDNLTDLILTAEITDGILTNGQFRYTINSSTKEIMEQNKASGAQISEEDEKVEDKPVTYTYTVDATYSNINKAKATFPSNLDSYKSQSELEEELMAESQTTTESDSK